MSFNTIILPTQSSSSSSRTLTTSAAPSYSLTPACSFFHDNHCEGQDEEDQICSLLTMMRGCYGQVEDLEPPAGHLTSNSTVSPTSKNTLTRVPRPVSPDPIKYAKDDTAVQTQPSRHVDYFSHNWKEEDIWSSWKLIVSKRKAYNNCARLENVSWRTWIKLKNKLKTVPPETLDWLKDCDVTWLYGPLQTGSDKTMHLPSTSPVNRSQISTSNSFLHKKTVLKKRSRSEVMLQRSLSSSSLLKGAAAAAQVQQSGHGGISWPAIGRKTSVYADPFSSRLLRGENTNTLSSILPSGLSLPGAGKQKHVHFNEHVEQCIALELEGDSDGEPDWYATHDHDRYSIMMMRSNSKRKLLALASKRTTRRQSAKAKRKAMAMLPSTTLKYGAETFDSRETAMQYSSNWNQAISFRRSGDLQTLEASTVMLLVIEDDVVTEGLFGQVVETMNMAKDIAHVVWNMGRIG